MAARPPLERHCWFDGAITALDDVRIHPLASSFLFGTGAFEGIRAYATKRGAAVFRMREHLERLERSAASYGIVMKYDVATLGDAIRETLRVNQMDAAYIRPIAYFDVSDKTVNLAASLHDTEVHVCIMVWKLPDFLTSGSSAFRVTVSPHEKFSSKAMPATAKVCGHYANSVLAYTEAARRGFHEAIMLNVRGEVSEATSENVFIVKDGLLTTNDVSADILMGVTRDSVLALARDLGFPTEIRPLTLADLRGADELFVTGTAAELKSVDELDDHRYPPQRPVSTALLEAYHRAVRGEDERHADWNTYVG